MYAVQEVGHQYQLDAAELCDEWVAYSKKNNDCDLNSENVDKFENVLHARNRQTPTSRKAVSRTKGRARDDGMIMFTQDDLGVLCVDIVITLYVLLHGMSGREQC